MRRAMGSDRHAPGDVSTQGQEEEGLLVASRRDKLW